MSTWNQNSGYGKSYLDRLTSSLPATHGKIFIVCAATNENYDKLADLLPPDPDGDVRLFTTIQAALDACVTQRDDYVITVPGVNFTITAALTMSKSRVHLICPSGIKEGGWPGETSITQSGSADCITITGNGCEVAGFWFVPKQGQDIIDIGTTWVSNIHHNYFGMASTDGSDNSAIIGTAPIQTSIYKNWFNNHSPGAMSGTDNDLGYFIRMSSAGATRACIVDNVFISGLNTEVTAAISYVGVQAIIARNYLVEDVAHGASEAGIFTLGISVAAGNFVVDNRVGIQTAGNAIDGMDAALDVENWGEALLT